MLFMKRIIFALSLLLAVSCTKDIDAYQNDPRAYFWELTNALAPQQLVSRTFSFAFVDSTVMVDTQYIPVKIEGFSENRDREFIAAVKTDSSTAVEGKDYLLLSGIIPANSFTGQLPVVLFRTPELKTTTLELQLYIADSADFKGGTVENNHYTLYWNDDLIKPNNWDTRPGLINYFGTYSVVKYKFIISILHRSQFDFLTSRVYDPTKITPDQMSDYAAQLKTALKAYNDTHNPPLTDEFGVQVSFP